MTKAGLFSSSAMTRSAIENVVYYRSGGYSSMLQLPQKGAMHGVRRVVTFCLLMAVLPTVLIIPLYLRYSVFADVTFKVAESDILEIVDGISNIFCQEHTLKMNSSFQAFQLRNFPTLSSNRTRIKLKKNFILPDDTIEYWGFYLLKGSHVTFSVCSRYEGLHILVVKGEKNLRSCGLREHTEMEINEVNVHIKVHSFQHHSVTTIAKKVSTEPRLYNREAQFEGEDDKESVKASNEDNARELTDDNEDTARESTDDNEDSARESTDDNEDNARESTNDNENNARESTVDNEDNAKESTDDNEDLGGDSGSDLEVNKDVQFLKSQIQKLFSSNQSVYSNNENKSDSATIPSRKVRHPNSKNQKLKSRSSNVTDGNKNSNRFKRNVNVLDAGDGHGGTANSATITDEAESSASSLENNLLLCYAGKILLNHEVDPSHTCSSSSVLENTFTVKTEHNVTHDGYYYYIFFSDNDLFPNRVHALFDILKPTYKYTNYTNVCVNQTECKFSLPFWSDEIVVVEVPTRDGMEHEDDDFTYLVSSCYPRMAVYIIFPITVLFIILGLCICLKYIISKTEEYFN